MIIIGLTGGIGMGKSTVARQFELLGAKTCSADACVHKLMERDGKAVGPIKKLFPDAVKDGQVDRKVLGHIVFSDKQKLAQLEAILHPLVQEMENAFIVRMKKSGVKMVVLDIPLLFETDGHDRVDFTVVVSAPHFVQKQRVMARKGMTAQRFEQIIANQMADLEKRRRADFIISTGLGKGYSFKEVKQLVSQLTGEF
jgi:dephospho-CoA kinase